jgi:hypothetical protein
MVVAKSVIAVMGGALVATPLCFKKSNICVSVVNQVGFVLNVIIGLQSRQDGLFNAKVEDFKISCYTEVGKLRG